MGSPIGRAGCAFVISSLVISRLLRLAPLEYKTGQLLAFCTFVSMCAIGVGVLLTLASVMGATRSFVAGNRQAFHSESLGELGGWLIACLLSLGAVAAFGYGFTHPSSTLANALKPGGEAWQTIPDRLAARRRPQARSRHSGTEYCDGHALERPFHAEHRRPRHAAAGRRDQCRLQHRIGRASRVHSDSSW